jgi:glycosyltransferase involved in cell wall biosynthesis
MTSAIAVFYLARLAEGFPPVQAFIESYRRHDAGVPHHLIIIAKGYSKAGEFAVLRNILGDIPHSVHVVNDDIGYDLHAYKHAAGHFDFSHACFINTFTEIKADHWLEKLYINVTKPGVGMVGATGTFESLYDSFKVLEKVNWLVHHTPRFDADLARTFKWWLAIVQAGWILPLRSPYRRVRRTVTDLLKRRRPWSNYLPDFERHWLMASDQGGPQEPWTKFPHFPNPHIRSNMFMVSKKAFSSTAIPSHSNIKIGCCEFESGHGGLSRNVMRQGLRLVLVGADGHGYEMDEWAASGTFRCGKQANLLATDNQTKAFDAMSPGEKWVHACFSWGGYSETIGGPPQILGHAFSAARPIAEAARGCLEKRSKPKAPLISIVIPTRGRNDLISEAAETVIRQKCKNFELVIFDNCSKRPIAERNISNDERVRIDRSDQFLSVTDSWNSAIDMARGDYTVLMGDDDGLAPGFCERIAELAERFDAPDLIVSNLYQFLHPGVLDVGQVRHLPMGTFFGGRDQPFVLDPKEAKNAVAGSIQLRRSFYFNSQAFTMSRTLLDRVRAGGAVFRSPFPDYYLANVALALSEKTVIEPRPLAIQGVSLGSVGSNVFANTLDLGFAALNHDLASDAVFQQMKREVMPGPMYWTNYILTMEYVARRLGEDYPKPDLSRYRRWQILDAVEAGRPLRSLWPTMRPQERMQALWARLMKRCNQDRYRELRKRASPYNYDHPLHVYNVGDYTTDVEVFEAIERGDI